MLARLDTGAGRSPQRQRRAVRYAPITRAFEPVWLASLWRSCAEAWLAFVAERDGQLVGFCSVATPSQDPSVGERTAEVGALYVDPGSWRRGAGRAMMSVALKELREQGLREGFLWVLPENLAALDFYRRLGF